MKVSGAHSQVKNNSHKRQPAEKSRSNVVRNFDVARGRVRDRERSVGTQGRRF